MPQHYTYRILHIITKREYIGARTSNIPPIDVLGIKYFSSSSDKEFMLDQKTNPKNYKYIIISIHPTRTSAIQEEIQLHQFFDVGINEDYYNKTKQTSTGFDTTGNKEIAKKISERMLGKVVVKDKHGNNSQVSVHDEKYLSGELVSINCGMVIVRDIENGSIKSVSLNEFHKNDNYNGINSNKTIINKDKNEKFVNKTELNVYLELGWKIGRLKGTFSNSHSNERRENIQP